MRAMALVRIHVDRLEQGRGGGVVELVAEPVAAEAMVQVRAILIGIEPVEILAERQKNAIGIGAQRAADTKVARPVLDQKQVDDGDRGLAMFGLVMREVAFVK